MWVSSGCPSAFVYLSKTVLSATMHAWLVHLPETYEEHVIARWYVYCMM